MVSTTANATNGHVSGHETVNGTNDILPVLIAGSGPVGLLGAYLLSRLGIKSRIYERHPTRLGAPKAHAVNARSLEICRQFGISVPEIRKLGSRREEACHVRFLTRLNGEELGYLPYERMDVPVLEDSPEILHNIPQPQFEEMLRQILQTDPNVEIVKGVEWVSCVQSKPLPTQPLGGVTSTLHRRSTGEKLEVTSRYLIGCDGAKSTVRQFLGITTTGEDAFDQMMTIHFNADLRSIIGPRTGMLHWIFEPSARGLIIGYDLGKTQVLLYNYDPVQDPAESFDEVKCRRIVDAALGTKIKYDILGKLPWVLNRRVADQYRVGNVFLAGDSAHSFPPTGGLGLNSGIGDIHNLVIKLAAVYHGWAADAYLDTYETDRRPVALVNSAQSVKNGIKILNLLRLLKTDEVDPDQARAAMMQRIRDPEVKRQIDLEIADQHEHFDNLGLHIGYVYGDHSTPANASDFVPRYTPGARLPHAWIRFAPTTHLTVPLAVDLSYVAEVDDAYRRDRTHSTLDLVPRDGLLLIVGRNVHEHDGLVQRLVGSDIPVTVACLGTDFDFVEARVGQTWTESWGLDRGGAVVVRSDQHVIAKVEHGEAAEAGVKKILEHLGHR